MNRVHIPSLPELEQKSPGGKYHSFCRNISVALGGIRNAGTWGGGHPFDLQIRRIPPGASVCPHHSHLVQWELFVVQSGEGTVRAGDETHPVKTGEVFVHPPGEAHQLINTGSEDLRHLGISSGSSVDVVDYPDSKKVAMAAGVKNADFKTATYVALGRITSADYYDGEDA